MQIPYFPYISEYKIHHVDSNGYISSIDEEVLYLDEYPVVDEEIFIAVIDGIPKKLNLTYLRYEPRPDESVYVYSLTDEQNIIGTLYFVERDLD